MNSGLVWFIVATVGSGLLGALLMAWLRRRFKFSDEDTIQETLGVSVSFVTLLFSFFLGFAIVNLWQAYEFADRLVLDEANEIRTLHDLLTQQPSVIDGDGNALIGTQVRQVSLRRMPFSKSSRERSRGRSPASSSLTTFSNSSRQASKGRTGAGGALESATQPL